MQINIISVGNIKEKYLKLAIDDYTSRIKKFAKFQNIELKDESNNLPKDIVLKKECEKIKQALKNNTFIIVMDIQGKEMTSEEFSEKIETLAINGNSHITFIIGGSYGIHGELKEKANLRLSFSRLTFPHQLFRVILLEQIYRSFKIMNNQKYHK